MFGNTELRACKKPNLLEQIQILKLDEERQLGVIKTSVKGLHSAFQKNILIPFIETGLERYILNDRSK